MTPGARAAADHRRRMPRDRTLQGAVRSPDRTERRFRAPEKDQIALPGTLDQEAFLGVLSHELRTPVTTIYGGAQLLATRDLPDTRRRALAKDVGRRRAASLAFTPVAVTTARR